MKTGSKKLPFEKSNETILKAAYDTESIVIYTFTCYLIENENYLYHETAMELMIHVFQYIEGAYSTALYHLRRLCENDPDNIGNMEMLLFFWSIPEKLVDGKEALNVSKRILEREPDNRAALETLSRINNL